MAFNKDGGSHSLSRIGSMRKCIPTSTLKFSVSDRANIFASSCIPSQRASAAEYKSQMRSSLPKSVPNIRQEGNTRHQCYRENKLIDTRSRHLKLHKTLCLGPMTTRRSQNVANLNLEMISGAALPFELLLSFNAYRVLMQVTNTIS